MTADAARDFVARVRAEGRRIAEKVAADVRIDAERIRAKLHGAADRESACFQTGRIDAADTIERRILVEFDNAAIRARGEGDG